MISIGKCQKTDFLELQIVRIENCQNWKLSGLGNVSDINGPNGKLSELENKFCCFLL